MVFVFCCIFYVDWNTEPLFGEIDTHTKQYRKQRRYLSTLIHILPLPYQNLFPNHGFISNEVDEKRMDVY